MKADISVVIPTHNRPSALARLIAALRAQDIATDRFEVIVVDDGSSPPTRFSAEGLALRVVRHERPRGPAAARNAGWRIASAPIIAFIDDDCAPVAAWLGAVLDAAQGDDMAVIQGPVEPMPDQRGQLTPLSHTIEVAGPSRLFVSANIAYSRSLLERVGGFDERFRRACGEDVELGARVLKAGARPRFARAALVHHEVRTLSLAAHLRHTLKWTDSVRALSMHPELRGLLNARVFWKASHPKLLLAAAGLGSRRPLIAVLAALPYLEHYRLAYRGSPVALARALPTHVAVDACEIGTALAGAIRYRTLML